jgi:hypothetical protein
MRRLQRWVDGESAALDGHLATCGYCAGRLEPLLEAQDVDLRPALLELLDVPAELPERLRAGIDARMSNRSDLMLIGEFFGLPIRMIRFLSTTTEGET